MLKDEQSNPHQKLYPIFYKSPFGNGTEITEKKLGNKRKRHSVGEDLRNTPKCPKTPSKLVQLHGNQQKEQLYLDLGQQQFGHVECGGCGMIYTNGQLNDTRDHYKYHIAHQRSNCISFKGWRNERVVERYDDGRIIVVLPTDHKCHLKKVEEIVQVVDEELGYVGMGCHIKARSKSFLFVSDQKQVVGIVMAEEVTEGYEMKISHSDGSANEDRRGEENWSCMSEIPKKVQLGISRVWVNSNHRRNGYATKLLDAARHHYFFAHIVPKEKVAYSDPTVDGQQLAMSYSKSDSVLVYKWSP